MKRLPNRATCRARLPPLSIAVSISFLARNSCKPTRLASKWVRESDRETTLRHEVGRNCGRLESAGVPADRPARILGGAHVIDTADDEFESEPERRRRPKRKLDLT